jgi:hypothetical protein
MTGRKGRWSAVGVGVVAILSLLIPSLSCAQTYEAPSPPPGAAPPASADDRLLTPDQQGRQGIVKGVAQQPFRDFNLIRSRIPPALLEAIADPYAKPQPGTCESIAYQVKRLNIALGPDLDEPASTEHPGVLTRTEGLARNAALDAMRSEEQSQIPFDGFIRFLSGAARHDRHVVAAIQAGAIRRAYLKGLGEAHACMPPSTPRHLARPVSFAETAPAPAN